MAYIPAHLSIYGPSLLTLFYAVVCPIMAYHYEGQRAQLPCLTDTLLSSSVKWSKLVYGGPGHVTLLTPLCVMSEELQCQVEGYSMDLETGDLIIEYLALENTGSYRCDTGTDVADTQLLVYEMPRIQMDPHYTRTPNGELGITWELIRGMTSPMSSLHIDYTIVKNDDVLYSDQMMLHEIFPRNASDKLANFGDIYFHGCNKGQVYKTTVTAFDEIGPIKGSTETFVFGCPLRLVSDVIVDDFDVHFNGTTTAEEVDTPVLRHDILLAISVAFGAFALVATVLFVCWHVKSKSKSKDKNYVNLRGGSNKKIQLTTLPNRAYQNGQRVTPNRVPSSSANRTSRITNSQASRLSRTVPGQSKPNPGFNPDEIRAQLLGYSRPTSPLASV